MTQVETIRKQLLKGHTMTQRSALLDFGIMALPRRIADLKETGFPVKSVMRSNPLTGQRYASYSFDDEVTHISQLKAGCVYRVHSIKTHVFSDRLLSNSDGFFQANRSGAAVAAITMAGSPQFLPQECLDDGDFKIKYIGGMH